MKPVLDPAQDERTTELIADVQPLSSFAQAASVVLDYLHSTYGLAVWLITRTAGDDLVVLQHQGDGYGVRPGGVVPWSASICSRMVQDEGPRVAPDAMAVPAYAEAPLARRHQVGTYVGVPLTGPHGELFGTLCGLDPCSSPAALAGAQPLFELQARLLSSLLAVELTAIAEARRAEVAESSASLDGLTGLLRRTAWDRLLQAEQERCRQHASPASILVLDLDGLQARNDHRGHAAGDELLARTGRIIAQSCRSTDLAARTGGDEFAVLCTGTPEGVAETVATRLQDRLQREGVQASVGVGGLDPRDGDLLAAWKRADAAMYADKRVRRGGPDRR